MFKCLSLHLRIIVSLWLSDYYYSEVFHMEFCILRIVFEGYLVELVVGVGTGGGDQY